MEGKIKMTPASESDWDEEEMGRLFEDGGEPITREEFDDMMAENMPYVPLKHSAPDVSFFGAVKDFIRLLRK